MLRLAVLRPKYRRLQQNIENPTSWQKTKSLYPDNRPNRHKTRHKILRRYPQINHKLLHSLLHRHQQNLRRLHLILTHQPSSLHPTQFLLRLRGVQRQLLQWSSWNHLSKYEWGELGDRCVFGGEGEMQGENGGGEIFGIAAGRYNSWCCQCEVSIWFLNWGSRRRQQIPFEAEPTKIRHLPPRINHQNLPHINPGLKTINISQVHPTQPKKPTPPLLNKIMPKAEKQHKMRINNRQRSINRWQFGLHPPTQPQLQFPSLHLRRSRSINNCQQFHNNIVHTITWVLVWGDNPSAAFHPLRPLDIVKPV